MYFLLEFIRKYYYVLLFLLLEAVSFFMLFRFNSFQGSVWFTSANTVVAEVNRLYSEAASYLNLRTVNRRLTDENLRLSLEADKLREALKTLHATPLTPGRLSVNCSKTIASYRQRSCQTPLPHVPATIWSSTVERMMAYSPKWGSLAVEASWASSIWQDRIIHWSFP